VQAIAARVAKATPDRRRAGRGELIAKKLPDIQFASNPRPSFGSRVGVTRLAECHGA